MAYIKNLVIMVTVLIMIGCTNRVVNVPVTTSDEIGETSNFLNIPPPVQPKVEKLKVYDPLEGKTFTFTANEASVQSVLYTIAVDAGLNLLISPDVLVQVSSEASSTGAVETKNLSNTITANFVNTPMRDAMDLVTEAGNVFYDVKGNILKISKMKTVNYSIPYLSVMSQYSAQLGGDMIGSSAGESNISGQFDLNYKKEEKLVDFYSLLKGNLDTIVKSGTYTVNELGGMLSVTSDYVTIQKVDKFLNDLVDNTLRQVQIEAKILEVTLNDAYSYGIEWDKLFQSAKSKGNNIVKVPGVSDFTGQFYLSFASNLSATVHAIETYGKVDTLASPRVTLLNGQNALLTAGTVTPYWEAEVTTDKGTTGVLERNVTYTKYTVMDGLSMGITVQVHDDDSVILNVVPITTTLLGNEELRDENGNIVATAPKMDLKEAATIVMVPDNEILVIGGLISTIKRTSTSSVPLLGDIPFLGYMFSSESVKYDKKELVILVKPTIVKNNVGIIKK